VYRAIDRIRRQYGYPLQVEWERYMRSSYLRTAEWNSRGEGKMTDGEMLPPRTGGLRMISLAGSGLLGTGSGLSMLGSGTGMSSAGTVFQAPTLSVDFHHGLIVPWDWQRVRARAAYLYSFYCCEFGTEDDFNFLRATMNKSYVTLTRGKYRLDFVYGWCQSPDDVRSAPKEFVY
jgi:hypothetical protein